MSFNTGSHSAVAAEINVTPLIDVLLVLLIIFMVIVPVLPRGIGALLPQEPRSTVVTPPEEPVFVKVHAAPDGSALYEINRQPVAGGDLEQSLSRTLAVRQDKSIFVEGARDLQFADIAEVIGQAHRAAAERIGILTHPTATTP